MLGSHFKLRRNLDLVESSRVLNGPGTDALLFPSSETVFAEHLRVARLDVKICQLEAQCFLNREAQGFVADHCLKERVAERVQS